MDDDKDLFSYDTSGNLEETGETSFDLNSFSSRPERTKRQEKGQSKGTYFKSGSYPVSCWTYYGEHNCVRLFALRLYYG